MVDATDDWPWPEIFGNAAYKYSAIEDPLERQGKAIADGLLAWGLVMAGHAPTSQFGEAMVEIFHVAGGATPEELSAKSQEWHAAWDARA